MEKCKILSLFLGVLMLTVHIPISFGLETAIEEEQAVSVKLIDVSAGDTKEDSACIFKVNGKTVVIDRREKETIDGITIYVQEVYPVNTEAEESDRCEFLYSASGEATEETSEANEEEPALQKEVIGEKVVQFVLGVRKEEETVEAVAESPAVREHVPAPEQTRVLVNGYDVTSEKDKEETDATGSAVQAEQKEENRLFSRVMSWLFG